MKSILVTGGAGFIGSHLVLALQKKYPDGLITVVDDFRSGDFRNLHGFTGDLFPLNIAEKSSLDVLKNYKFDYVYHLASITDTTNHNQAEQCIQNIEGFRNIIRLTHTHHTPVVYASSASVYGARNEGEVMKESDLRLPLNAYAYSKCQIENIANLLTAKTPNWRLVGLRFFNVYGENERAKGESASMVYQLARRIFEGDNHVNLFRFGEQARDFIYVKDVVAALITAAENSYKADIINIGTGAATTFNDLVKTISKVVKKEVDISYVYNPHHQKFQSWTRADVTKFSKELKIEPKYSLHKALEEMFDAWESSS